MNKARLVFVGALLAPLLVAACASGDDVTLTPPTGDSISTLSCAVSAGENICGRVFDVPAQDRANFVAQLQSTALFASEVHELTVRLFAVCDAMAGELGVTAVGLPEDKPLQKRKAVCDAVGKEIKSNTQESSFVVAGGWSCSPLDLPPCARSPALPIPALERCDPPATTLGPSVKRSGDPARLQAIDDTVTRHGSELAWLERQNDSIFQLEEIVTSHSFEAADHRYELACIVDALGRVSDAQDEFQFFLDGYGALPISRYSPPPSP
ncbi:MAG: hypothetical protein JWO86_726 [Myxococcaceae bacterium]|jgi:hypothetical protein|nr:hypothetical protein [Myxococcaceae bacterium]